MASQFLYTPPLRDQLERSAERIPDQAASALTEADESLVVDPRGGQTPTQMVDQKLLALQKTGNPGLFLQASGRPQDIRRIPRSREASVPG